MEQNTVVAKKRFCFCCGRKGLSMLGVADGDDDEAMQCCVEALLLSVPF